MKCPRCIGGRCFRDYWEGRYVCLNCGWREPEPPLFEPDEAKEDVRRVHYGKRKFEQRQNTTPEMMEQALARRRDA